MLGLARLDGHELVSGLGNCLASQSISPSDLCVSCHCAGLMGVART